MRASPCTPAWPWRPCWAAAWCSAANAGISDSFPAHRKNAPPGVHFFRGSFGGAALFPRRALVVVLGIGDDEGLLVGVVLVGTGALAPHAVKPAEGENVIAVLIVVGDVIGVCEDQHIVIRGVAAAGVDADDHL